MTDFQLQEGNRIRREIQVLEERIQLFKSVQNSFPANPDFNKVHYLLEIHSCINGSSGRSSFHKTMDEKHISVELLQRCQEEMYECSLRIIRLFEKEILKLQQQFNSL